MPVTTIKFDTMLSNIFNEAGIAHYNITRAHDYLRARTNNKRALFLYASAKGEQWPKVPNFPK